MPVPTDAPSSKAIGARRLAMILAAWFFATLVTTLAPTQALAQPTAATTEAESSRADAPLIVGHREIHVFRTRLGEFSAEERAASARKRIESAFEIGGEGWTSISAEGPGTMVALDGQPMFMVLPGDSAPGRGESAEVQASRASRALQTAWREAQENSQPQPPWTAMLKSLLALAAALLGLAVVWALSRRVRDAVTQRLSQSVLALPDAVRATSLAPLTLSLASRGCVLVAWLLSLLVMFVFLTFTLDQFALTRALGEGLFSVFKDLVIEVLRAIVGALPGLFIAAAIFLATWVCTQISSELFHQVAQGRLKVGMLDAHTAPATRHIVNATLWLFALAMAYPYLPGAETEAFKGLTVIVGLMVSIGASGPVGQIASGVILVYTRALSLGEYVRIQDTEGTVTEIGLFVTRLRTGMGAEIALPNALVLGNVTMNYSRVRPGPGFQHETSVTIGYDAPWRQVHAMLEMAAAQVPHVATDPRPVVLQTALSDAYVAYKLVVQVMADDPDLRAQTMSHLRAAIQDIFNRYGVQIMSPVYYEDPAQPKVVPESQWFAAPARREDAADGNAARDA